MYNTILLTIVNMLSVPRIYLSCNWKFVPLDHLLEIPPPLATPILFSVSMSLLYFLKTPQASEIIQYLSAPALISQ